MIHSGVDDPRLFRQARRAEVTTNMSLVDNVGLWCEIAHSDCGGRAALFLDRDGVVVEETDYLGRAEDVRMIPDAARAIGQCNQRNTPVVLVTNQSGIARGLYGWKGFQDVQAALSASLRSAGAHVDATLACAYHIEGRPPYQIADHWWRKPNPGMIIEAGRRLRLDLGRSWIIGDRATDIESGRAASLAGGILVSTGYGKEQTDAALRQANRRYVVETSNTLADAVATLTARGELRT
jgi:D-glycero-D-manno-heptose 1,7-bisphosphate phosphatase